MSDQRTNDIVEDTEAPPERADSSDAEDAHPAGIRFIALVIGVMVSCGAIPYLVPGLEQFRPWVPGTELPFSGLFTFEPPVERPAIASGGAGEQALESEEDLLAAAPLPEARPRPARPTPAAPHSTDGGPDGTTATEAAAPTAPRIAAEHIEGLTREIEDWNGDEMRFFYSRLAAVGSREPGALARITVYNVSTNGADRVTSTIRHGLQEIFGDGGKGYVPISPGWTYQAHRDVEWAYHNWRTAVVNRARMPEGRYGLAGVLASNAGPHSWATFGTMDEGPSNRAVSMFRVFYMAWPDGGELTLHVDGEERARVPLQADEMEDRVHELSVPRGPHELAIRVGEGNVRVYGVTMENDGPGVVVDALMLIGASVRAAQNFDEEHIAAQVRQREPDLLLFWLGGNDVISRWFTPTRFQSDYNEAIRRVRAGRPEASCLVVSVLDKGHMVDGSIRTRAYVEAVVRSQEQVAREQGCAFFNLYEATGGRGTMNRWYHANPRLAVDDFSHLTESGARVVGNLIRRALLAGYDDWLAAGGP